jgi:radical SAM superfamily enzyme YgiQ (UPF0313 family)
LEVALLNLRDGISKNEFPQLGLLYIASVLRGEGHTVDFFDATAENETVEKIFAAIKIFRPDVCGFSIYTGGLLKQYEFMKEVKTALPDCIIIAGGPHASALPRRTMEECAYINYLVCGEGEVTIPKLLKTIESGQDVSQINGLHYRDNDKVIATEPRELIKDLDAIPLPAYDLILSKGYRYHNRKMEVGNKTAALMSSRGCPWNCNFCYKKIFGTSYRRRSPGNVVDEIKFLTSRFGYNDITFVDDLFTANRRWLKEFCQELKKNNIGIPWKCLARVDTINKEDMEMMKESGCYGIEFGVESGNEEILKDINKKITVAQIRKAFKAARQVGLMTSAFFIFGHRKETKETVFQTMALAKEIKPDFCGFAGLLPFPGTGVYELLDDNTKYNWNIFDSYYQYKHPISLCSISADNLQKYGKQASVEYYGRIGYLTNNILFSRHRLKIKVYQFLFFGFYIFQKMLLKIKNASVFRKS